MQLSAEQQQALEQQKAQCPFCKIVKGEIPSRKIYEDDLVLGILDINPSTKGHVLFMPKEHYPIMPLLPPETFKHLFKRTYAVCDAIRKAMLATGMNVFIANGGAAGQQSQHFMLHIIPREKDDGLSNFEINPGTIPPNEIVSVKEMLTNNLGIMMGNHFKRNPAEWHNPTTDRAGSISQKFSLDQVVAIIQQNPQLRKAIEESPDEVEKLIEKNEQLQMLFKDVSFNDVLERLDVSRKGKAQNAKKSSEEKNTSNKEHDNKESNKKKNSQDEKNNKTSKSEDVDLDSITDLF